MMDSSDQNDRQDGKSRTRSPRHGSNAVRDVLTTVAKLNNIGRSTAAILRASTVGGSNDSDPSAAKTADCPASPRPAHTSTFQGPGEDDTRVEASSQTIPLSPPGPLPVTQGAHVQDSQYPPPGLVFGNRGPPPGFSAANQQQIDNFGPLGFRGLPPPPGFGPSFGNRLYSPVFRPPMMFEKCFSLAATRVVSISIPSRLTCYSQSRSTTTDYFAIDAVEARTWAGSIAAVMTLMPGSLSLSRMETRYVRNCLVTVNLVELPN